MPDIRHAVLFARAVTIMACPFPKAFFVTGTDTGVGKTVVSAILCLGLPAHYWKPVQSGFDPASELFAERRMASPLQAGAELHFDAGEESLLGAGTKSPVIAGTDSAFLLKARVDARCVYPERYLLSRPLSPHLSARLEGKRIALADFTLPDMGAAKHLVVEGAGGLLVPMNDEQLMVDLIKHLNLPVLLVARSGLGTINHTLLSLEALQRRSLQVLGVVMTGERNDENRKAIEQFGQVKVIAQVPVLPDFERTTLLACFSECFI